LQALHVRDVGLFKNGNLENWKYIIIALTVAIRQWSIYCWKEETWL